MNPLKQQVKRGLQQVAARFGPHTRRATAPRLVILMYHRVLPRDDARISYEEPGMYVTPETFGNHIKYISQYFEIIKLSDWIDRQRKALPLPASCCAITFDDGWADNYDFAFPVLQAHQVPATVFLVSDMIDTRETFWPERLIRLVHTLFDNHELFAIPENQWLQPIIGSTALTRHPSPEQMSAIIARAKSLADMRILELIAKSENAAGIDADDTPSLLSWRQVGEMLESGLVDVGSHTRRHTRLDSSLEVAALEDEIVTSKKVIEKHTGRPVSLFCFPNGDYSSIALDIVRANYAGAVTTRTDWNSADTEPHLLNRMGIHEDSTGDRIAFLARISKWL